MAERRATASGGGTKPGEEAEKTSLLVSKRRCMGVGGNGGEAFFFWRRFLLVEEARPLSATAVGERVDPRSGLRQLPASSELHRHGGTETQGRSSRIPVRRRGRSIGARYKSTGWEDGDEREMECIDPIPFHWYEALSSSPSCPSSKIEVCVPVPMCARSREERRGEEEDEVKRTSVSPPRLHTLLPMALALRCPAAATSPSPARSPFLPSSSPCPPARPLRRPAGSCRCHYYYGDGAGGFRKNYDHIPKQFREENLKDGLMDNYKNVPQFLYGLSPAQMEMFMNDDNPYNHQSQKVTEIVPAVTELIAAQFLWLDYDDRTKPIYLYINSTGTMDENNEIVASETDAYAIADFINRSKSKVYTINLSMAYGQAAMLLSLGVKGKRGVLPNSITKLHLPKVHKSGGAAIDMWIKAKELDTNTDYYLELLSKGVGKPKEELAEFLKGPRYFRAQEAIDYGLADTILHSLDGSFKPKDLTAQLAKAQEMRQSGKRAAAGAGRWSTPTAPR
ncbi:hypothetical protein PR202_gb02293 [Eleusine coracana subsp. coracana]|uniref:ATP-dependent Clp protease proteolytic subunit n=1 Tax=Eleusine coracana subsp. coracana TaxID=191504 RepID=A0AAV5DYL1_ELECO|nr:hypothetical protein PR202_gb02293 [Eleusine coracana subsp. coracana]